MVSSRRQVSTAEWRTSARPLTAVILLQRRDGLRLLSDGELFLSVFEKMSNRLDFSRIRGVFFDSLARKGLKEVYTRFRRFVRDTLRKFQRTVE